jgi:ribonuclease HII
MNEKLFPTKKWERALWKKGYKRVAGVDEAGRGALAGPLVAAAVVLPRGFYLPEVRDSKELTPKKREELFEEIVAASLAYNIVQVSSEEIDNLGIKRAHLKALCMVVEGLKPPPDFILCDYYALPFPNSKSITHGDSLCFSIACASILAKVYRDKLMEDYHVIYPHYNFKENKGYGTKNHFKALRDFGPSSIHRLSYRGVGFWEESLEGIVEKR